MSNPDWLRVYAMTGLYVMLALGLNVVAGFAGLLDLAYVAFFGIGGYLFALLSSGRLNIHLPFLLTLPLAAFASMGVALALGSTSVRLKGEYLAVVTLAFAQVFKVVLVNLDRPIDITGGLHGLYGFDPIRVLGFTLTSPAAYACLIWLAAFAVMIACFRLRRSHYGRCWEAVRENPLAAEALGVNTSMMKLRAFACGAFIAGAAGAFFASYQDAVFPSLFDFPRLITVFCMVILGGLGSVVGAILGAILLSILPGILPQQGAYPMMVYGLILIVLMALRPQGILGSRNSRAVAMITRQEHKTVFQGGPADLSHTLKQEGENQPIGDYGQGKRAVLQVKEVSRNFGGVTAVDGISFHLCEREILSITGPNGAGKTTLFNMISGFYPPLSGSILYEGKDISGLKPHKIVKAGIARSFQNPRLFDTLSLMDNARVSRFCRSRCGVLSILFNLRSYRSEERETTRRVEEVLAFLGDMFPADRLAQAAKSLSHADRRRLEIALAISTGPKVLMLDEPSAGMSPEETGAITAFIRKLRDELGCAVLLIEHKLSVVKSLSDRVIALDCGRKIAEGPYEEVARNPAVIQAFHGSSSPR